MGEQSNPGDSISFVIPQVTSPANGYAVGSLEDHMELPTVGVLAGGNTYTHNVLPLRAYNLIWNQWFKDENLCASIQVQMGDGPDLENAYELKRRGKRHDYFTSCLPWPQKGNTAVSLPLGTTAPIITTGDARPTFNYGNQTNQNLFATTTAANPPITGSGGQSTTPNPLVWNNPKLVADLSAATAATINQIRQAFQIQKLLERDARGGTRYTEIVRAHFGVQSPDARLQRPEYLGGGSTPISINPVAQTSNTPVSGTPQGNLSAFGTAVSRHGFSQSFVEHGYVIGLVNVRADLTYQQGVRKMWNRNTRYDFYFPAFAMLGEQPVLLREIYARGDAVADVSVFGYQERWAEYRYHPPSVTGLFRSTAAGTIDPWHLAQRFTTAPTLNETFISDDPPLSRILAVGAGANGQQLIMDAFFDIRAARPLPLYSVPGQIDRF